MPCTVLDARDAEVSEARQVPAPEAFLFRRWVCVCVCVLGAGVGGMRVGANPLYLRARHAARKCKAPRPRELK